MSVLSTEREVLFHISIAITGSKNLVCYTNNFLIDFLDIAVLLLKADYIRSLYLKKKIPNKNSSS